MPGKTLMTDHNHKITSQNTCSGAKFRFYDKNVGIIRLECYDQDYNIVNGVTISLVIMCLGGKSLLL